MRPLLLVTLAVGALAAASGPVSGQAVEENSLLREAAARESRGDFEGAERVLRRLLATTPTSSGALFALQRVLRAEGEPAALLPAVDTFLAHDPSASGVRDLKLRLLVELDSLAGVEREAERWLGALPASEAAYRGVASVYQRAFGPARSLEVLTRGRAALGRADAFALEIGDGLAATGHTDDAVREWVVAVGDDGGGVGAVARRVAALPGDPRAAGRALVGLLGSAPEPGRRRAGVQVALELGLGEEALGLARRLAPGMSERDRVAFLAEVARRARAAALPEVAGWAYGQLGQGAGTPAERLQFDQRLVEISLAAGDTAAALDAQRRVVASFSPGSVDRRRAAAQQIRLEAALSGSEALTVSLDAFREEYPDAPELDELAAHLAGLRLAHGDAAGAAVLLEGMDGPRSALQRGYILLGEGRAEEARRAFLTALPGLGPQEATPVIQLASLLGRLSGQGSVLLARVGALAHGGRAAALDSLLEASLEGIPGDEWPALLAEAARQADSGGAPEKGAALRERILRDHPASPESEEAALALARWRAASPEGRAEAIRLLEELVARAPGAALVPEARRELERLRRGS